MTRKLLVADLLCGAGGSSTGCRRAMDALGLSMELVCVNHWPVAIDTHQRNHPEARHYVQDISTVRPHELVPEGYLDLLMASPTCTHHSVARGGKPTSDQQRSDPWHIITWLTELRVKRLIIENVWEFVGWGPVDHRTGKPVKSRKGEYFHAWIETIKRLGFDSQWRKLNAADYGDATTRQRFILMARSDRKRLLWPMPTHQKRGRITGDMFGDLQPWRPAWEIIDRSIRGRSIFNRVKPLVPRTLQRIYAGAVKFGWPEPYLLLLLGEIENSLLFYIRWTFSRRHEPEQKAKRAKRRAVVSRLIEDLRYLRAAPNEFAGGGRAAAQFVVTLRRNGDGRSVDEPIPALTAGGKHIGLAQLVLSQHNSGAARAADQPLPTITTGGAAAETRPGCARPILVEPIVVSTAHGVDDSERSPHGRRVRSVSDPIGAVHAGAGNFALVEPFMLSQASGGAPRATSEPVPTATTGGNGASHALVSPYYGSGSGDSCETANEPLPTVTSKARFGLVVPVTQSNGGAQARDADFDPMPTMTTARGVELALAEVAPAYDILFRMFEVHELAAAMGFNTEDRAYEFAGTKTEQIKQIGNAVSVAKMQACVTAIMADAAPDERGKRAGGFKEVAE